LCLDPTPLEVFILGGAILLHDTANCIAAFPGRLKDVRATLEWADAETEWRTRKGLDRDVALPDSGETSILFETLRALHAERAKTLARLEVTTKAGAVRLLQDDQLRIHLETIMGEIAASHHWDVESLMGLPVKIGALANMPASWTIRPILLGALLRCADAAQLDQRRAPDFLYGLLQLHGLSEEHWRAQNRLAAPHVDDSDPAALVFSSTKPFDEEDAGAWWIALDAITQTNRELQACDSLLRDLKPPRFALNSVQGAVSPARLAQHVRVRGWRPVAAEVRMTPPAGFNSARASSSASALLSHTSK
jgi:hypothetical protein